VKAPLREFGLHCVGLVCSAVVGVSACDRRAEPDPNQTAASTSAALHAAAPSAAAVGHKPEASEQEACGVDQSGTVRDSSERTVRDPKTGREVTQVGQSIDKATERTTLAAAMKEPEKLVGKTIVVEGDVKAMCTHRRGWFAIVDESSQVPLRIVAVPNFLVPANAIGKKSRAAGVLEIQELSPQAASHLSSDHGLPNSRRAVTLRASGAEFL
jgi:hypothetical protein